MNIKDEFGWAIPLTDDEKDNIWNNAILTVDTNVLLDLYRYHKNTSDSILISLEKFSERVWLSRQAAEEFFRNRNAVISEAKEKIEEGKKFTDNILAEIDKFASSNRAIDDEFIKKVKNKIKSSIQDVINESPNYLGNEDIHSHDDILDRIIKLFGDYLGEPLPEEDLNNLIEEGKRRIKDKIPPGYKDQNKDSNQYGDFFLWEQILRYGEKENKPIILITSEKKEDWWERISGKTVGLRPELRKEAWTRFKQPLIVYQTQRFLELSKNRAEREKSKNKDIIKGLGKAIAEVKAFNLEKRTPIVSSIIQDTIIADTEKNEGFIKCIVNKPVTYFTVSGHFSPTLISKPKINVNLIVSPMKNFEYININANTGTNHDFNIHLKSYEESFLPGEYIFQYNATIEE